jgi:hypothetical protein
MGPILFDQLEIPGVTSRAPYPELDFALRSGEHRSV